MHKVLAKNSKQLLFCPGPVNLAKNVKESAISHEIGHREEEFSTLLSSLNSKLLQLFNLKKPHKYYPIIITGSGTAANEAILSSVVGNKRILIISNGEFGERLFDISKIHNKNTYNLKFAWGQKMDIEEIEKIMKRSKIEMVSMVHHETSTGMLNSIKEIGKLCKKYNAKLLIDTVSSAGVEKINLEEWNVAFCSSSAGKAIGSFPGLSFVIGEVSEFEKLKNMSAKTMYLNLYKFYTYSKMFLQTPNTPAVSLFFALDQALANILAERKKTVLSRTVQRTNLLRAGMKSMGLKFLLEEKDASSVLTTIILPGGVEFKFLRKQLKQKNIVIYNGKGPLLNKVFQVGSIGELNKEDILFFLKSLKEALDTFKDSQTALKKQNPIHLHNYI